MVFHATKIAGVFEVDLEPKPDERGFFARSWCWQEFKAHGFDATIAQCSVSFNTRRGTLRGMHYQTLPHAETKLVRCTRGAMYDVAVDLRPQSATFKSWVAAILTAENHRMMYVPEGCAHGFLTLEDKTEVFYQMTEFYDAQSARGVRWNDPAFEIAWPEAVQVISERDRSYPDFK
jgi:dTDP-4-dehydrorhamnose 3,5-epimerase